MTKIVSAAEFERNFLRFQEEAKTGPIAITRDGQAETVLMSVELYDLIVKGRVARSTVDLDEATLDAIRNSKVPEGYEHLDELLGDWNP